MSAYIRRFRAFLRRNETAKGLFLVGVVLLGVFAVWYGIRFALSTEYPILVVSSGSMCPPVNCTLPVGALIVIRGQDPNTIQAGPPCGTAEGPNPYGSIIVFRPYPSQPDYLVVHRVRQVVQDAFGQLSFRTQGDNYVTNPSCDGWIIPASSVVGVYQSTIPIPYLGSIILALRQFMYGDSCDFQASCRPTSQGLLVIVALIVALFAFEVIEPSKKSSPPKPPSPPSPTVQPQGKGQPDVKSASLVG